MLRRIVIFVLALILMLPTPLLAQDATPTPRPNGELLFSTDFNSPGELEAVFDANYMAYDVHDGVATLASAGGSGVEGVLLPGRRYGDFIFEVDINPQSAPAGSHFGLFFRSSEALYMYDGFYSLRFYPNEGGLSLVYYPPDQGVSELLGNVSLDGLGYIPGGMNHLRVEAVGDGFTAFLNGHFALQAQKAQRAEGTLGLTIGVPSDRPEGLTVRSDFDNLRVYAPGTQAAAPAPAAEPAAEPTATTAPAAEGAEGAEATESGFIGRVSTKSARLNVRSGPGATFPIMGKLLKDAIVSVNTRDADCTWLYVTGPGVAGWVSRPFVELKLVQCSDVPLTGSDGAGAAPAATPATEPAAAETPAGAPPATTPAAPAAAPSMSTPVTNFETFGTWRRGDEAWGTFTASSNQVDGGKTAAKLAYDFPAGVPDGKNFVVFRRTIPIAGKPNALAMSVYGDASGSLLNAWVTDAGGLVWQFHFGPVNHTGWQTMTAALDTTAPWPVGVVLGDQANPTFDFPIKLSALVLDYPGDDAHAGVIYLDNLAALSN